MRYAIISDIHSNIEALGVVFDAIDRLKIDRIISLGDVVGYNANPNECVELLSGRSIESVMGNHDECAAGLAEPFDFNQLAAEALYWTRGVLTEANADYLKSLKRKIVSEDGVIFVHGSIDDTGEYLTSVRQVARVFRRMQQLNSGLCFFGHTHVARAYRCPRPCDEAEEGDVELIDGARFALDPGFAYLVNPGSVGQPRDSNPDAAFVVYDSKKSTIERVRVAYDIDAAADKVLRAGLPVRLATRLKLGW